jgi:hypothetical protein
MMLRRLCGGAFALLFGVAACGKADGAANAPAAALDSPPSAALAAAAPPAPAQDVTGHWCLRTVTRPSNVKPAIDGSGWELNADGSFAHDGDLAQRGKWTLTPGKLTLTGVGEHEVIEVDKEHMLLRRMGSEFRFHRECGAEIDDAKRASALRKAASKGDLLILKAVLAKGARVNDVDPLDPARRTPLLAALEGGHAQVALELLELGADVTAVTAGERTAFDFARRGAAQLLGQLAARVQRPGTLEVPAMRAMPENGKCPTNHIELRKVCVHAYALPRRALHEEITAFTAGAESPTLATNHWKDEITVAELTRSQELEGDQGYESFGKVKIDKRGRLRKARQLSEEQSDECDATRAAISARRRGRDVETSNELFGASLSELESRFAQFCQ